MIKKIISGGQTGAGRAALDVAIKFNIPHGGWGPKGCIAEDGPLSNNYHLQEMPTSSYPALTEQNVIDSDATLIFSRGETAGGTEYTRKMALKHKRKMFHIDLNIATSYDAASLILSWIKLHDIKTLNVSGSRASKDGQIYGDVFRVLEIAFLMVGVQKERQSSQSKTKIFAKPLKPPGTVAEAVERLTTALSLKDKTTIANMAEAELSTLHFNLREYIRNEFGLWSGNKDLIKSCSLIVKLDKVHEDQASAIIIQQLWSRLRETHKLRVVK